MPLIKTKQPILFTQAAAVTVANLDTETTLVSTGEGSLTIQKNSFSVGKTFKVKALGFYSTTGTPTITLKFKAGSTVLVNSGALATANNSSNAGFSFEALVTVYSLGASGTTYGQGVCIQDNLAPQLATNTSTVTLDTTANQALNVTAQWSAASASNTITITNLVVEELN